MSSKARTFEKEVEKREALIRNAMYFSCLGSCITTVAKLAQKTEKEIMDIFPQLQHNRDFAKSKNVKEGVEWLFNYFDVREDFKKYIVLVYDERGIFTPIITLCIDGENFLPLDKSGTRFGVLGYEDAKMEYVFEDDEDDDSKSNKIEDSENNE